MDGFLTQVDFLVFNWVCVAMSGCGSFGVGGWLGHFLCGSAVACAGVLHLPGDGIVVHLHFAVGTGHVAVGTGHIAE